MRSIEILRAEHSLIRRALDIVRAVHQTFARKQAVSSEDLEDLLDFFVNFADRVHQRKEEFLLFPWLKNHGIPIEFGPVACMDMEHERLRLRLSRVRAFDVNDPEDVLVLTAELREMEEELRRHIEVEDTMLFRVAEECSADDSELVEAFQEAVPNGVGLEAHYRQLLERLEGRFGLLSTPACRPPEEAQGNGNGRRGGPG